MAEGLLKSHAFRREREHVWRDLEALVAKAEQSGLRSPDAEQAFRLPTLYRATLSSLSVARAISLDRNLLNYLENLSVRAYLIVYGARGDPVQALKDYLRRGLPAAVRGIGGYLLAALGILLAGVTAGYLLTAADPVWFYTFVDPGMAGERGPEATAAQLRDTLYDTDASVDSMLHLFATYLFTHNATVGFLGFALGFALGVPTALLVFYNGAVLGAMTAVFAGHGLTWDFLAWVAVHGTTEIPAILLCAGAGMSLGAAIVLPGTGTRLHNLRRRGRLAGRVVIGAVGMFLVAGLLEGFARQLITDPWERAGVGGLMLLGWLGYFLAAGREAGRGDA